MNGDKVQYRRGPNTIVDTGTTIIIAPPKDADAFWSQVPGSGRYEPAPAYYTYPCNQPPDVSFTFGSSSTQWSIAPSDMNLGRVSAGSDICVGALVGQDRRSDALGVCDPAHLVFAVGISAWILGGTFMKSKPKNHAIGDDLRAS